MNASGYRYKQNRFQQLRGFCYAASLGSVSKAARRMYLSQPAVSQQIQSLENELAVTLFVRRGSKMQLTHDGELLFEMARPLIEALENLDEQFRQRRSEVDEGHVEIAAGLSTIMYFLPKHVEAFRQAYPKIEVRLQHVTGLEGLERLRTGLVDLAVGPLMQIPADIEFHPIISYDAVVMTCLGHPLAQKENLTQGFMDERPPDRISCRSWSCQDPRKSRSRRLAHWSRWASTWSGPPKPRSRRSDPLGLARSPENCGRSTGRVS